MKVFIVICSICIDQFDQQQPNHFIGGFCLFISWNLVIGSGTSVFYLKMNGKDLYCFIDKMHPLITHQSKWASKPNKYDFINEFFW